MLFPECQIESAYCSDTFDEHPQAERCHAQVVDEDKLGHIHRLAICHHLLGDGDGNQICKQESFIFSASHSGVYKVSLYFMSRAVLAT